ncbi:alpha/beta fold hydrolase [Fredinandcohnia sp. 179-A 10B2 NHS]|uniref:alpha/beta fold hydrolase n=1 Tax=Fredinandcohnia sp. 179-A 10B2 NHS TaxID=3235176 RepID=UPI00399FE959
MAVFTREKNYEIPENGLCSVETISLGGIKQTILLQAVDVTKPVLLILHGGPSLPIPGVSSKGYDYTIVTNTKELIKHFVVVFWDQRGTGKSYHASISNNTMTISQFVSDAVELTDYLRNRFVQEKIFLAAHSWGSTVGLNLVANCPEKYHSYVGLSQIVSWTENDKLSYAWLKNEAVNRRNQKALRELEAVGEPPYVESFEQWGVIRKWQQRFNTLIYTGAEHSPSLFKLTMDMMKSREYSLKDMYHTFYKGFKLVYSRHFIEELATNNFMDSLKEISIPVTFIHGRHDFHVNGRLVETYYNKLKADKGKRLIWSEKSAHVFHPEDTKQIEQHLIEELQHIK